MERKLIFPTLVVLLAIASCGIDNYERVPGLTECVLMELPWYSKKDGGTVTSIPLRTGNINMGDSDENIALFVDMGLQTTSINIQVLMKDELNQDMELKLNYQVIPGQSPLLVLNYLGNYHKKQGWSWVYDLDLKDILSINILPSFDMVSRMVVSEYESGNIPRERLKDDILHKLKERLGNIKRPKIAVDSAGKVVYDTGEEMAITDVIDIVSVDIGAMPAPAEVQSIIKEIETKNADLETAKLALERAQLQRQVSLTEARRIAEQNRKITENWTDALRIYYLQKLMVEKIPEARNCRIYYLPKGSNITVGAIGSPPNFAPAGQ